MSSPEPVTSQKLDLPVQSPASRTAGILSPEIAQAIATSLAELEFGSVEITIHNSRVVQIERHERIRFASAGREEPVPSRRRSGSGA